MLRRLLMMLLIACLAAPAVAMPLEPVAQDAAMADCHGNPPEPDQDDRAAADHGCIGCLAPFRIALIAEKPERLVAVPTLPALSAQRTDHLSAPEPPPPRG